jgi:hypothetical protein
LFVIHVVLLLIVMFYVLFMCKCVLPPGVNPTAVDKYIDIDISTYSECVCSLSYPACKAYSLCYVIISGCLPVPYFPTVIHERHAV